MKAGGVLESCLYAEDLEAAERFYAGVMGGKLPGVVVQDGEVQAQGETRRPLPPSHPGAGGVPASALVPRLLYV